MSPALSVSFPRKPCFATLEAAFTSVCQSAELSFHVLFLVRISLKNRLFEIAT